MAKNRSLLVINEDFEPFFNEILPSAVAVQQALSVDAIILLPDAGPLITLAYADSLDLLFKPGWSVQIVDMVLNEVTRHQTPTSKAIGNWVSSNAISICSTQVFERYQHRQQNNGLPQKSHLGELAIQETMNAFALNIPTSISVFLFEDHKIARASFLLPENCRKVSTRAYLLFLEQKAWLESAVDIERKAVINGRHFSQLYFSEEWVNQPA